MPAGPADLIVHLYSAEPAFSARSCPASMP